MPTEYRFYCAELQREVSTAECYDRGNTGRACYGEVCAHVETAILRIAHDRLKERFGDQITLEIQEAGDLLRIRLHESLLLEVHYDRLFRTLDYDAILGIIHGHGFPAEDVDDLVRIVGELLRGEKSFVVRPGWSFSGGSLRLLAREELARMWRKYIRGRRVKIVDGRGVHTKSEYEGWVKNSAC